MKRPVLIAAAAVAGLIAAAAAVYMIGALIAQTQITRTCVQDGPAGCAVLATVNKQTGACQLTGPSAPPPGSLAYEVDCTLAGG